MLRPNNLGEGGHTSKFITNNLKFEVWYRRGGYQYKLHRIGPLVQHYKFTSIYNFIILDNGSRIDLQSGSMLERITRRTI